MQVSFKNEFVHMFNKLPRTLKVRAQAFMQLVYDDLLNKVSGPHQFPNIKSLQSILYTISMESTNRLKNHLQSKNLTLDPDIAIFSIVGSGLVVLFAMNLKNQRALEIWTIKPLKKP